jgi:glutamine synthetase
MASEELTMIAYCDLAGLVRGRSVPTASFDERLRAGVGWVPANQAITCFGPLAEPNPWGSVGDRRLIPDPTTRTRVDLWQGVAPLDFALSDAVHTDGTPWDACPRTFLRHALDDLRAETGLRLVAALEHEFVLDSPGPAEGPFTLAAQRMAEPFAGDVMAALRQAGVEPEMILPEYGPNQWEVLVSPTEGIGAADRAAIVKEVVREVARRLGRRASFSPLPDPDGIGNGVHVHLSLLDDEGLNALYDETRPGALSALGGAFAAGLLHHLPALLAFTAPSAISYLRLTPHRWSAGTGALGYRNRECAVRICPVAELGGGDLSRQFNLEYRAMDGTASPHLALALLVRAGLAGIRGRLETPPLLDRDPTGLSAEELAPFGARPMPGDLEAALQAVEEDALLRAWLPDELWDCYRSLKASELADVRDCTPAEACRRYAAVL